jgi:hypothetical protein
MSTLEMTLLVDSKSDIALRALAQTDQPLRMRDIDGNTIINSRGMVRRRVVGRKHGKQVRYWIEVAP